MKSDENIDIYTTFESENDRGGGSERSKKPVLAREREAR